MTDFLSAKRWSCPCGPKSWLWLHRAFALHRREVAQRQDLAQLRPMIRLLAFVDGVLGFYLMISLITVIVSGLIAFDVINIRNNLVRSVTYALSARTDPVLNPLRKVIPPVGGLDLTFLVLLVLIQLIRSLIIPHLADLFQ